MNLTNISAATFKKILALLKKKEALLGKIASIDAELSRFEPGGRPAPAKAGRGRARRAAGPRVSTPRGQLRDKILAELKAAGKNGMTVQELAAKLKHKDRNVYAWFMQTGKKIKTIKNLGSGRFRWQE
ncbi:MAG TPA: hypothetical protein P5555_02285 [Candidatus Paceibacterota bacterium]|nr:hypothetical protein [Verrucomicrobiota bacterium]HOX01956.1 hypothetical protein [Verrucomicrobiota bacterium]HRZ44001.1 hypothetical protein [Candidatus Paceibacterota bacterium]